MNTKETRLIENYLYGKMSEDEKRDFMKRVASDTDFSNRFVFERQLFETLGKQKWSFGNYNDKNIKDYKKLFESGEIKELKKVIKKVGKNYRNTKEER